MTFLPSLRCLPMVALLATCLLQLACRGESASTSPPTRQPPPGAPNVLVLVVDTLRADRLAHSGPHGPTAPEIDALAAEGVRFDLAYSSAARTWQSFTSILTGLQPPHHGVRQLFDTPLSSEIPHLGSILGDNGYATAAFDVIPFLRWMTNGRGFASYIDTTELQREGQLGDGELLHALTDWTKALPQGKPFFAFVRLHGPHWPYQAPVDIHDRVVAAVGLDHAAIDHSFNAGSYGTEVTFEDERVVDVRIEDVEARRLRIFGPMYPPAVQEHMQLHYDLSVRRVSSDIGQALDALRSAGILDQTLVILTADHGESFGGTGYHAYRDHGPRVDEAALRVPLVVRFPASARRGAAGQHVSQLVRLVDVLPTVLATIGLPSPANIDGTSLLPILDDGVDLGLEAYGESEVELPEIDPLLFLPGLQGRHRMLRQGRWKYIRIPDGKDGIEMLFDMQNAGEQRDVAADHPAELAHMRGRMEAVLATDIDLHRAVRVPELSPAQKEQLRVLGYE